MVKSALVLLLSILSSVHVETFRSFKLAGLISSGALDCRLSFSSARIRSCRLHTCASLWRMSSVPSRDSEQRTIVDDLTLDDVVMSFEAVLEQFRASNSNLSGEAEGEVCRKLMATRLPNLHLDRCRVAPSKLHGLGDESSVLSNALHEVSRGQRSL